MFILDEGSSVEEVFGIYSIRFFVELLIEIILIFSLKDVGYKGFTDL